MPNKIQNRIRNRKMKVQNGLCYYCERPMWIQDIHGFCARTGFSERQAQSLKCTAEHLTARRDQGPTNDKNIVAACFRCNQERHAGGTALSPAGFKLYIQQMRNARDLSDEPR